MGYENKIENPIIEDKLLQVEKDISCEEIILKCEEALKKSKFLRIKKQKTLNIIEAQYKSFMKYAIIKIKIQDVFGLKRIYINVMSEYRMYMGIKNLNISEFVLNKFLHSLDLKYLEI